MPKLFGNAGVDLRSQSVAAAGTFLNVQFTVDVDEAALVGLGYPSADLADLPVAAYHYRIEAGEPVFLASEPMVRIRHGVWGAGIAAPTVATGTNVGTTIVCGLSDDIQLPWPNPTSTTKAPLRPDKVSGSGCSVRWIRASS